MRARPRAGAALLVTMLAAVPACTVGSTAPAPAPAGGPGAGALPTLPAPEDFQVRLAHSEQPRRADILDWRTRWVLEWRPVAGASGYEIHFATSEGPSARVRRVQEPRVALEVAAGSSRRSRLDEDRSLQLALSAAALQVQVVALGADGTTEGASSAWFPVGEVPPGGIPMGGTAEEHHH